LQKFRQYLTFKFVVTLQSELCWLCLMEYASLFYSVVMSFNWIEFVNAGICRCTSARCGAEYLWVCVSECIVEDAREGSAERGNDWSFLPFTNCEGRETSPVQDIRHLIWFLDYIAVWTAAGRNILAPYDLFSLFVFLLSDRVKITW